MKRRGRPLRRREALILAFLGTALAALVAYLGASRRTFDVRMPSLLRKAEAPAPRVRGPEPEAVLRREVGSLRALVAAAARGELLAQSPTRGLVVLDQGLVEALLKAQLPAEHVVAGQFRVVVENAQVRFEDGLALVRIDGRVLADGGPVDVYAALSVYGDLDLVPRAEGVDALHMRITVNAVEAKEVDLPVKSRRADRIVEAVSRASVEEFAALAPELDVPVRWVYPVEIPGVGPEGPVRIDPASVRVGLRLAEVRALSGRLWLAVDLTVDDAAGAPHAAPVHTEAVSALESADLLKAEQVRLHATLDEHLQKDPVLAQVLASGGDLTFMLPSGVLTLLAEEVAIRYLDRVALSLENIRVKKDGEMHKSTALGRVHSGSWRLAAELDGVKGVLRAGRPRVDLRDGGRLGLRVPVRIENGSGTAALHFQWDSHGIANLVCRDFEVKEQVSGAVVKEELSLVGEVTLAAEGDELRLTPRFERRHRLHVAPHEGAWDAVRGAVQAQDKLLRCGLALKPDDVMSQLRELVGRGFVVKLPESLFRQVRLPSVLAHSLKVADRDVSVEALETALRTGRERVLLALRLRITLKGPEGSEAVEGARRPPAGR